MIRALSRMTLASLALTPFAAPAQTPTTEYYTIQGNSARELRAQMKRLGPLDDAGKRNDGNTNWDIQWRYDYDRTPKGCTITNIRVTLALRVTLPRWTPGPSAPQALVETWTRFIGALRLHEMGHVDLSIAAADEVRRVLEANRRGPDCPTAEATLNAAGMKVLDDLRRRHERYNRDTDSGGKQGTNVLERAPTGGR
ncbi:MAG: DUF922 domain-containing protein [Steroidobacteraceae bacterium]|nr:DUF922 domain-containing protein [Steroidobacteraceae bacterium]